MPNDVSNPKFVPAPKIYAVRPAPSSNTKPPASPYNQPVTKGAVTGVKSDSGGN
jgi:hypothetical protein